MEENLQVDNHTSGSFIATHFLYKQFCDLPHSNSNCGPNIQNHESISHQNHKSLNYCFSKEKPQEKNHSSRVLTFLSASKQLIIIIIAYFSNKQEVYEDGRKLILLFTDKL